MPAPGNVYVIDLYGVTTNDNIDPSNVAALNLADYPSAYLGKGPLYITSGQQVGQFLVSNSKDFDSGLAGITFGTYSSDGTLTGSASLTDTALTPAATDSSWLQAHDQQNIQRSAGTVIVNYQGQTYALVADYNFLFNDPHYNDENFGLGQQIGGKIGVIQDPFGTNGGPVYLGATTPIPGVALNQLTLDQNGMLYGVGFVDDTSGFYSPDEMMYDSMFVWNAGQLIQAALNADQAGRPTSIPIDRTSALGPQNPAVTPARYDGTGLTAAQMFGSIYGVGTYTAPQGTPQLTLRDLPFLRRLGSSGAVAAAGGTTLPAADESNPTRDTAETRLVAESIFLFEGVLAAAYNVLGVNNSQQLAAMRTASQVLNTFTYGNDQSAESVIDQTVETVAKGLLEAPLEVVDIVARLGAVLHSDANGAPADVPSLSIMAQSYDAGATQSDLFKQAFLNTLMVSPLGVGISSYNLTTAAINGDVEGILSNAIGLGLGFAATSKLGMSPQNSETVALMKKSIKNISLKLQQLRAAKVTRSPGAVIKKGAAADTGNQAPLDQAGLPNVTASDPNAPKNNGLVPDETGGTVAELNQELQGDTQLSTDPMASPQAPEPGMFYGRDTCTHSVRSRPY